MSANSKIEWTDHTFNVAWGCIKASPGCDHCYADRDATRYGYDIWGVGKTRRTFGESYWAQPLKWDAAARGAGVRKRVFCSSMTDLFLNDPIIDAERAKLWPLIEKTPNLDWLLLTKHPERFVTQLPAKLPSNVWLGVSVENGDYAWRTDALRKTSAAVRFLSLEPLLGHIPAIVLQDMDWIIVGGESGPHARAIDIRWVRDIRDDCEAMDIPFFFKQWGEWAPASELATTIGDVDAVNARFEPRKEPDPNQMMIRVGRKNAGRTLDGRIWSQFPTSITMACAVASPPRLRSAKRPNIALSVHMETKNGP